MLQLPTPTKENYKVLLYRLADHNADEVSTHCYSQGSIHNNADIYTNSLTLKLLLDPKTLFAHN